MRGGGDYGGAVVETLWTKGLMLEKNGSVLQTVRFVVDFYTAIGSNSQRVLAYFLACRTHSDHVSLAVLMKV